MISEDNVPDHWKILQIGDVIDDAINGGTPKRSEDEYWDGSIPWLSSSEVRGKYTTAEPEESITKKGLNESSAKIWPEGTVLVAMYGRGTIGRPAITSTKLSGNQAICGLLPHKNIIDDEYLYYWLENIRDRLADKGRGATASQQNLNQSIITGTKIPVPPLKEQEQIVQTVENQLSIISDLEHIASNLESKIREYENSLFAFRLSGYGSISDKPISGTPSKEEIPRDWKISALHEISSRKQSTIEPDPNETYDYYSFEAVDRYSNGIPTSGDRIDSRKRKLEGGEILISRMNPRINRVCRVVADPGNPPIASTEFVAIDVTSEDVTDEYVELFLQSPFVKERLVSKTSGSTGSRSRVGFDFVMDTEVLIPPLKDQHSIVEHLTEVKNKAHNLFESLNGVQEHFDEYLQSVLNHAFCGKIHEPPEMYKTDGQQSQETLSPDNR